VDDADGDGVDENGGNVEGEDGGGVDEEVEESRPRES
jgi:hypothetical protein